MQGDRGHTQPVTLSNSVWFPAHLFPLSDEAAYVGVGGQEDGEQPLARVDEGAAELPPDQCIINHGYSGDTFVLICCDRGILQGLWLSEPIAKITLCVPEPVLAQFSALSKANV